ncbi:hypothetical protein [Rhizobium sullae]|uniref:hypothetical protein n=1 Tax=Rhizobium sullae TaxID=50338 RepID=UPI0012FDC738|nr:hypothetical protein [Rhizobium sullae]
MDHLDNSPHSWLRSPDATNALRYEFRRVASLRRTAANNARQTMATGQKAVDLEVSFLAAMEMFDRKGQPQHRRNAPAEKQSYEKRDQPRMHRASTMWPAQAH